MSEERDLAPMIENMIEDYRTQITELLRKNAWLAETLTGLMMTQSEPHQRTDPLQDWVDSRRTDFRRVNR